MQAYTRSDDGSRSLSQVRKPGVPSSEEVDSIPISNRIAKLIPLRSSRLLGNAPAMAVLPRVENFGAGAPPSKPKDFEFFESAC